MNWEKIHKVFFVGIGGIGMSALARYFHANDKEVYGYDLTATELTSNLQEEGINIVFEDEVYLLPDNIDLAIYTPAIPKNSNLLNALKESEIPLYKRAEVLGMLSKDYFTVAVAGSHGKTSVSTMITHLLKTGGIDCTAFLGGISINYNSNYVPGKSKVLVVEADEYDRSFLQLCPNIAVITAIDTDHLDIYGSKENITEAFYSFAGQVNKSGLLIEHYNDVVFNKSTTVSSIKYGLNNPKGPHVENIHSEEGELIFDLSLNDTKVDECCLQNGALHNVENMLAASLVAEKLDVESALIKQGVKNFRGVKRRFELIYSDEEYTYIDDYAHHPKEIEALINALRNLYPKKHITAIFQPHLYSRTRDLAEEFASALSLADSQIIMSVYPAIELPIEGVSSALIADVLDRENCRMSDDLLVQLENIENGVIVTIGAGNIDKQVPVIKKYLQSKKQLEKR